MYGSLINHQWKKALRSGVFRRGWGIRIFVFFMVLYFGASFLFLGIVLPEILADSYPQVEKQTPLLSRFVLFYFLIFLLLRLPMQSLSVLSVQHYLILPMRRSKVLHFLLQKSIFDLFNLLPLLIVVPWAIRVIPDEYGNMAAVFWLISMLLLVLCQHFGAVYLKRVVAVKSHVYWISLVILGGLILGDYLVYLPLREISATLTLPLATQAWTVMVPLLILVLLYRLNFNFLLRFTHLDQWQTQAKKAGKDRLAFLERRGIMSHLMAQELKMIWRNRRTRSITFATLLGGLYGLIFYPDSSGASDAVGWVFASTFMTGIFVINYGQFLTSWESSYFDGILTRALPVKEYYRAKLYLMWLSCALMWVLTLPYLYFGVDALLVNTACALFNAGVNSFVMVYASTYLKKPIDLSKGAAFNYQGTSAMQFLVGIPLLLVPVLLFLGFHFFDAFYMGIGALALAGLLGFALTPYFLRETEKNFKEKKHQKAAGYRGG